MSAEETVKGLGAQPSGAPVGGRTRVCTFIQKIDNPLSPIKQGRGTWVQRCAWLPTGILVYETLATLKDIPFSDAWGIRTKWVVRPTGTTAAMGSPKSSPHRSPPRPAPRAAPTTGDCGLDSPQCQVTVSVECIFWKKLLWAGKMESETLASSVRSYRELQPKLVSFLQADAQPAAADLPLDVIVEDPRDGESEVDMLKRRLAICEGILLKGAQVHLAKNAGEKSGFWGSRHGRKIGAGAGFVIRAEHDAVSGSWTWVSEPKSSDGLHLEVTTTAPPA